MISNLLNMPMQMMMPGLMLTMLKTDMLALNRSAAYAYEKGQHGRRKMPCGALPIKRRKFKFWVTHIVNPIEHNNAIILAINQA